MNPCTTLHQLAFLASGENIVKTAVEPRFINLVPNSWMVWVQILASSSRLSTFYLFIYFYLFMFWMALSLPIVGAHFPVNNTEILIHSLYVTLHVILYIKHKKTEHVLIE